MPLTADVHFEQLRSEKASHFWKKIIHGLLLDLDAVIFALAERSSTKAMDKLRLIPDNQSHQKSTKQIEHARGVCSLCASFAKRANILVGGIVGTRCWRPKRTFGE